MSNKKLADVSPRTRWQGWTIVEKDGRFALDIFRDPYIWKRKKDAEECKDDDMRVVRCELRLLP
jgi:hypothetical protein